jgi:hypothetical protein
MATTFLYRCPSTAQTVQGWSAGEVTDDDTSFQSVCAWRARRRAYRKSIGPYRSQGPDTVVEEASASAVLRLPQRPQRG